MSTMLAPGARTTTLEDVFHNDGVASMLVPFLELQDKRNLRLVCHAGKDAVDKTVTAVYTPGVIPRLHRDPNTSNQDILHARILSKSNWKGIKSLVYSPCLVHSRSKPPYYESQGLAQIAKAGLSKLESLTFWYVEVNARESADDLVKAGWKLKELVIMRKRIYAGRIRSEWFGTLVRDANWPLEDLTIGNCTDSIAALIAVSDWKLKSLYLLHSNETLSAEGVETLMQGSWVSTLERLSLAFNNKVDKGVRAISRASQRAINLLQLKIISCPCGNKDALILAEGSYPNLNQLHVLGCVQVSGIAAILRKCPKLEEFYLPIQKNSSTDPPLAFHVDDPEDAKLVAEHYKKGIFRVHESHLDIFKASLAAYL